MTTEIRNIPKHELAVLQAHSLRELIEKVNGINSNSFDCSKMILREDIVELVREDGTFFLLYYK